MSNEKKPDQIVLTVPQTAIFLGLTPAAVRNLIHRKRLPYRKLGRRVFVICEELLAFLSSLKGVSPEEALFHVDEGQK